MGTLASILLYGLLYINLIEAIPQNYGNVFSLQPFLRIKSNIELKVKNAYYPSHAMKPEQKKKEESNAFLKTINDDNETALSIFMNLMNSKLGWTFVSRKDGVLVEKRMLKAGPYVSPTDADKGTKHACVKSNGIIDAPPSEVFKLFLDNSRVHEYNEHCNQVKDVHCIPKSDKDNNWTKLTWASTPKYGPFKAREFLSVVHYRRYNNGCYLILNRPAYLNGNIGDNFQINNEKKKKYVKATILLAGNYIEPYGNNQTYFTQIAHINPGGGADTKTAAWVINQLCAVGPSKFIRKLEKAAKKFL